MKIKLNDNDRLVLKFIDTTKRHRNWIHNLIFLSWSKKFKTKSRHELLSKKEVENSLRKLTHHGLIQTEKWEQVHSRVYFSIPKEKKCCVD